MEDKLLYVLTDVIGYEFNIYGVFSNRDKAVEICEKLNRRFMEHPSIKPDTGDYYIIQEYIDGETSIDV